MTTATIVYQGNLRNELTHSESNVRMVTDAPKDNNGNGASFSPTDLTAVSLGACMLTIMGINASAKGFEFVEATASILKEMTSSPRRIGRIEVKLKIKDESYSKREKAILESSALNCPVALSLHPDIEQKVYFEYYQ